MLKPLHNIRDICFLYTKYFEMFFFYFRARLNLNEKKKVKNLIFCEQLASGNTANFKPTKM